MLSGTAPALGIGSPFIGAMVKKSADQTAANYTTATAIAWQTEVYANGGWFDAGSPTIFTVPVGVTRIRAGGGVHLADISTTDRIELVLRKNNLVDYDGQVALSAPFGNSPGIRSITSGPIVCTSGDTFALYLEVASDTSSTVSADRSHFWIEEVVSDLPFSARWFERRSTRPLRTTQAGLSSLGIPKFMTLAAGSTRVSLRALSLSRQACATFGLALRFAWRMSRLPSSATSKSSRMVRFLLAGSGKLTSLAPPLPA